jgi:3-phenylpropionate/trans-cinnamate dioxygenase ferredoxin reductase subunit
MDGKRGIVIVGAGHAGVQLAASLREEGFEDKITLISDDPRLPYQRPPLSKAYMKREATADSLILRGPAFYEQKQIDLRLGVETIAIDRAAHAVRLRSGESVPYARLVLATGGLARPFAVPGAELSGVHVLRDMGDADALRDRLEHSKNVVVIGAGFIGLEFAAVAAKAGLNVAIVEVAPRVMGRAVSPVLSEFYAQAHRDFGADVLLGMGVAAIVGEGGEARGVKLSDGRVLPADFVVVGIGVVARDGLAKAAGLDCPNGVRVDALLATSDPDIFAVGDVALHPNAWANREMRLESVQNATDQARALARTLTGKPTPYDALPWFWSDQGDLKLQMAGLMDKADAYVTRGDPATRAFSVFGFAGGRLVAVESVNKPADHMLARKLIGAGVAVTPEQAGDADFDLRALAKAAA